VDTKSLQCRTLKGRLRQPEKMRIPVERPIPFSQLREREREREREKERERERESERASERARERRLLLRLANAEKDSESNKKSTRREGDNLEESATRALMRHESDGRGGRG